MPDFHSIPRPITSKWGSVDHATELLPGIWEVSTPSHGGLVLSERRQAAMPEPLRLDDGEYEEDVLWSLIVLGFEAEFARARRAAAAAFVQLAHDTARNWQPDRYAAFTGKPVATRDSPVRLQREAFAAAIGELVVVSAFGSWADWVPEGKVGLVGRKLEALDHLARPTYSGEGVQALVDKDRYDSSRGVNSFAAIGAEIIAAPTCAPTTKEVRLP